jgi:hypothetical protein
MGTNGRTSSHPTRELLESNGTLLDIGAVAVALGVTPRHVQRLVSERRFRSSKSGGLFGSTPRN